MTHVSSFSVDVFHRLLSFPVILVPLSSLFIPFIFRYTRPGWGCVRIHTRRTGVLYIEEKMNSASGSEDSEVACYVLGAFLLHNKRVTCLINSVFLSFICQSAYLLHENYSQTASAFLKECRSLPRETLLVRPSVFLESNLTSLDCLFLSHFRYYRKHHSNQLSTNTNRDMIQVS